MYILYVGYIGTCMYMRCVDCIGIGGTFERLSAAADKFIVRVSDGFPITNNYIHVACNQTTCGRS